MQLTKHFSLEELTRSDFAIRKGIANTPGDAELANLRTLAESLEEVRLLLGTPIYVSSGYRSPYVNLSVGGSRSSAHMQGLAADFTSPAFGSPYVICQVLAKSSLRFDQLIHEYGTWVHIGVGGSWRRQILTIDRSGTRLGL